MGKATGVEARDGERVDASVFIIASFGGISGDAMLYEPPENLRSVLISDWTGVLIGD